MSEAVRFQQGNVHVFGEHDGATVAQMHECLKSSGAVRGVLCADGHLGYAQPVGGVVAYKDAISVSGVGFDIACGNLAIRTDVPFGAANKDADTLAGAVRKLLRANADLEIERDELKAERERYESPAWEANERMNGVIDHLANTIEEEIRCLTLLRNELRGRLDGEAATKFFPVIDRAIDRLGESVKEYPTTMVKPQLRYVFARGETIAEQRDHVRSTPLYAMGDAKLIWVNEGDLWNLALRGVANPIDTGKPEL